MTYPQSPLLIPFMPYKYCLQSLILRDIPKPYHQSFKLLENLGGHLTHLKFEFNREDEGLGLPWWQEGMPPSMPALQSLTFEDCCPTASDLHYILHAAPNMKLFSLEPLNIVVASHTRDDRAAAAADGSTCPVDTQQLVDKFRLTMQLLRNPLMYGCDCVDELTFADQAAASRAADLVGALRELNNTQGHPARPRDSIKVLGLSGVWGTAEAGTSTGDASRSDDGRHSGNSTLTVDQGLAAALPVTVTDLMLKDCHIAGKETLSALARALPNLCALQIVRCSGVQQKDLEELKGHLQDRYFNYTIN